MTTPPLARARVPVRKPHSTATWLQFIPHAKVSAYAALGWQATDGLSTTHHGIYAIIMKWQGEGVPPQC